MHFRASLVQRRTCNFLHQEEILCFHTNYEKSQNINSIFCINFVLLREMYYLSISLKSGNIGLKQTSPRMTPHAGSAAER